MLLQLISVLGALMVLSGRRSQSCEGPAYRSPALFMTVRREIVELRRETGARSPEDLRHTRAVR
jgi:hypothetical protein